MSGITSDIRDIYQQMILEHNRKPRNFGPLENANRSAEGFNPVCGDHFHVHLHVDDHDLIDAVHFEGTGCAISKSSASLMTGAVKGKSLAEASVLFEQFHELLKGTLKPEDPRNSLGKLNIFSGIWEYPARVKCAALAWHTLKNAIDHADQTAVTE